MLKPKSLKTQKVSRNISLDILKLVLSIFVIGLHTNFLADINPTLNKLSVNGLFRIAVPIFFIVNGFFFFNVLEKNNFKKWIKRILILYTFWMIFYIIYWLKAFSDISNIIKTLFFGFGHLWYVIAMFQAALVVYLFKNKSSLKLFIFSMILFFMGLTLQYVKCYNIQLSSNIFLTNTLHDINTYRNFLFLAFPFFGIGYLINKENVYQKITKRYLIIGLIMGFIILITESYLNGIYALKEGFDFLFSLIIFCPFLFITIYKIPLFSKSNIIGLYANALYYIHILALLLLYKFFNLKPTIMTFSTILLSLFLAFVLVEINKKIKFIL